MRNPRDIHVEYAPGTGDDQPRRRALWTTAQSLQECVFVSARL